MKQWSGHDATTSAVFLALLLKAQSGGMEFSRSHLMFVTVCEFWAAAMNEALQPHLSECADFRLHSAEVSFRALGLKRAARILHRGRNQLKHSHSADSLSRISKGMELSLSRLREPVDQEIARFANAHPCDWLVST